MSVTALTMTRALLLERHIPKELQDDWEHIRNFAIKAAVSIDAAREGEVDQDVAPFAFACNPDESAGLADVVELDAYSRRVKDVAS